MDYVLTDYITVLLYNSIIFLMMMVMLLALVGNIKFVQTSIDLQILKIYIEIIYMSLDELLGKSHNLEFQEVNVLLEGSFSCSKSVLRIMVPKHVSLLTLAESL